MEEYQKVNIQPALPLSEMLKLIDDALCFGFEFIVKNHELYFREVY